MWSFNSSEDLRNYAAGAQSIAVIIGGVWALRRIFQFRVGKPKIDLNLNATFVERQKGKWIVEVEALLENKAKVRHKFKNFTFEIRYTLAADELENRIVKGDGGKDIVLSATFPHLAAKSSWLDDAEAAEDRLDYGALEAGETDRWTFVACVPEDATMIFARSELYDEQSDEYIETKKVVAAPN
jgi:hypothetical protein